MTAERDAVAAIGGKFRPARVQTFYTTRIEDDITLPVQRQDAIVAAVDVYEFPRWVEANSSRVDDPRVEAERPLRHALLSEAEDRSVAVAVRPARARYE